MNSAKNRGPASLETEGQQLLDAGRFDAAAVVFRELARQQPNSQAQNLLGIALAREGRVAEALVAFDEASNLDPGNASPHLNRGVALAEQHELRAAITSFEKAIELDPGYVEAHHNLAIAFRTIGDKSAAVERFRLVLKIAPDHIGALQNLGTTLTELKRSGEASVVLKHLTRLRPDFADAFSSLGLAQLAEGRYCDAEASFERALQIDPKLSFGHVNLGTVYKEQGRLEEAIASYDLGIELNPDSPSAHWNRALALLQAGNYEKGFAEYEWRWRREASPPRPFNVPMWNGSDLRGKAILLHAEQGLGDTMMFVRYAPLIKARGASRLTLEAPAPLAKLLGGVAGIDQIIATGEPSPSFDVHLPLMSAPFVFRTTLGNIPHDAPYLRLDANLVEQVGLLVHRAADEKLKIGIAWQGNPHHQHDGFRSTTLEMFRPLARLAHVRLFNLQRGPGREQLDIWRKSMGIVDLIDHDIIGDEWLRCAALMKCLDHVITVDTATAHVAGALAINTTILLSASADWRWMQARSDSPWYPTVRLLRQKTLNDWGELIKRAAEEFCNPPHCL